MKKDMNGENKKNKLIVDIVSYNILALMIFVLCIVVSMGFIIIGVFVIPVIYIYITAKHGVKWGILSLIIFGIVAFFITDIYLAVLFSVSLITTCILPGYAINKNYSIYIAFAFGLIGIIIGMLVFGLLLKTLYSLAISDLLINEIQAALAVNEDATRFLYVLSNSMLTGSADISALTNTSLSVDFMRDAVVRNYQQILISALPMMLSSISAFLGIINVVIAGNLIKCLKPPKFEIPPFSQWALPSHFGNFVILFLFLSWLGLVFNWNNFIIVNALVNGFANVVFSIQGMALVDWLLKKKIDVIGVRWLIILGSYLLLSALNLYMWIGLFDQIIRIRQRSSVSE